MSGYIDRSGVEIPIAWREREKPRPPYPGQVELETLCGMHPDNRQDAIARLVGDHLIRAELRELAAQIIECADWESDT